MRKGQHVWVWATALAVGSVVGWAIAGTPGLSAEDDLVVSGLAVTSTTAVVTTQPDVDPEPEAAVEPAPVVPPESPAEPEPPAAPPGRPPTEVTVLVANGTGVPGLAGRWSERLADAGHPTLPAVDGDPTEQTIVWFVPGADAEALDVVERLGLDGRTAVPLPDPPPFDAREALVVVLVGADLG